MNDDNDKHACRYMDNKRTHLKPLVHHGGTVECDFGSHVPVGVCGGLGLDGPRIVLAHTEELILGKVTEGSSRCCQDDAPESTGRDSLQTLKDGTVLRIGRKHVDTVLLHEWVDDGTSRNEGFLVGKGNVLLELDGLNRLCVCVFLCMHIGIDERHKASIL